MGGGKLGFAGTCANCFDDDGLCTVPGLPWASASDFAVAVENAAEVGPEAFLSCADIPDGVRRAVRGHGVLHMMTGDGVLVLYDGDADIHYFFCGHGSAPSHAPGAPGSGFRLREPLTAPAAMIAAGCLLAQALPRRWRHVQAVAAKAAGMAVDLLDGDDARALTAAAWLHDAGYAPGVAATGFHPLDGARWLRLSGADDRICGLVAWHSCSWFEAMEIGLADALAAFPRERSVVSDALLSADMTTGPDGQELSVAERISDIKARYGEGHTVTRCMCLAEQSIMAAVHRTADRLGHPTNPCP